MSNPNKSYFDKYITPVVREIDKVNVYEFENGMDYELTTSGKTINVDTIKEAQSKVLKNLKKDPNFYTNMLVNETIKMVGEYGSGKKPGVKSTAKSAEAVKKDGKMPKADKQDAPFGLKDEVKGKYKSSGMEPAKKVPGSLNEGYDVYTLNPASYLAAMDHNGQLIKSVRDAIKGDVALKNIVVKKLKQYAEKHDKDEEIQDKVKKAVKTINDAPMRESKGIPSEQLTKLKQLVSKLKEEGKKDLASALERLLDKGVEEGMDYTISNQETADKPGPGFYNQGSLSGFEEDINEDVNVKDSRKIKLTPTTKNQILTLVHEMAKSMKENNAYDFKTSSGNTITKSFSSDNAARQFDADNQNINGFKKIQ
jgi:hypothetical protein